MTIYSGDIKLNGSKVMLDVPEGGGGPTANVIPDGVSNAVFPDISEMDRVNGRVNLRQLHLTVQTDTTDTYLGANVVVADPPEDPNVSITLFSTSNAFDTRAEAIARMEAYLNIGAAYQGYLFGNHIAGQSTLLILQRSDTPIAIGETLVLTKREGYSDQFQQYVRVTQASVTKHVFTDEFGDYQRYRQEVTLSDVLRADFLGFDPMRYELTAEAMRQRTKISGTVVANAARYYGVAPLVNAASAGDFVLKAASVFTQLVPSAQVETPIADLRTNQTAVALLATGGIFTNTFTITSSQPTMTLSYGSPITPGTFRQFSPAQNQTLLDDGAGVLTRDGVAVGTIDYENGMGTITNVIGNLTYQVSFEAAVVPTSITQSQGFEVTQSNRALNYIRTIEPPPVPGSLSVSFRAQDRWYVLRDDGTGALRSADSSIGAGSVNSTTGTAMVTFGAMPDVDTMVIYQWVEPGSDRQVDVPLSSDGKFYIALNADGLQSETPATTTFEPGSVSLSWTASGNTYVVNDDGVGGLTGGGSSGTVDYGAGVIRLRPGLLPPVGTVITVSKQGQTSASSSAAVSLVGDDLHFNVGADVAPGSVSFTIPGQSMFSYSGSAVQPFGDAGEVFTVRDDTQGMLYLSVGADIGVSAFGADVGTINYVTGACVVSRRPAVNLAAATLLARYVPLLEFYYSESINLRVQ